MPRKTRSRPPAPAPRCPWANKPARAARLQGWRAGVGIHPAPARGMDNQTLATFRRTLLARRSSLLTRWRKALSDENELLAVREPDWQDTAATTSAIIVLDGIGQQERH